MADAGVKKNKLTAPIWDVYGEPSAREHEIWPAVKTDRVTSPGQSAHPAGRQDDRAAVSSLPKLNVGKKRHAASPLHNAMKAVKAAFYLGCLGIIQRLT